MSQTTSRRVLTLPNLLSVVRLTMIPVFAMLYRRGFAVRSAIVLVLSGVTDLLDGWIARTFGSISDLGKVLDPVADKLTIAVVLGMLVCDHPIMIMPLVILVIKEAVMAITGAIAAARTSTVTGAVWHGKVTTALTYGTMFIHIIWQEIPGVASNTMAVLCTGMMLLSMALYTTDNIRRIRSGRGGYTNAQ